MSEALSSSVVSTFLWSPLLLSTLACWQNQGRFLAKAGRGGGRDAHPSAREKRHIVASPGQCQDSRDRLCVCACRTLTREGQCTRVVCNKHGIPVSPASRWSSVTVSAAVVVTGVGCYGVRHVWSEKSLSCDETKVLGAVSVGLFWKMGICCDPMGGCVFGVSTFVWGRLQHQLEGEDFHMWKMDSFFTCSQSKAFSFSLSPSFQNN